MINHLRDKTDPKHPDYPKSWWVYVSWICVGIIILGVLVACVLAWHDTVVLELSLALWREGEQFGQGVLHPPVCGAGKGH